MAIVTVATNLMRTMRMPDGDSLLAQRCNSVSLTRKPSVILPSMDRREPRPTLGHPQRTIGGDAGNRTRVHYSEPQSSTGVAYESVLLGPALCHKHLERRDQDQLKVPITPDTDGRCLLDIPRFGRGELFQLSPASIDIVFFSVAEKVKGGGPFGPQISTLLDVYPQHCS